KSSGTPPQLNEIADLLIADANVQAYSEIYPAAWKIIVSDTFPTDIDSVAELLGEADLGGVRGFVEYTEVDDDDTFIFADADVAQTDEAKGFSVANALIAVGAGDGVDPYIIASNNGEDWTEKAMTAPKNIQLNAVAFGNSRYVGVGKVDGGGDALIVRSMDGGETWQEQANPSNFDLTAVGFGNGVFIAVGYATGSGAYIITSTDGAAWTIRANPTDARLRGIDYDGSSRWCAVGHSSGGDAYIIISDNDGVSWTEQSNPKALDLHAVAHDKIGRWIAVGEADTDPYIVTSLNGEDWTEQDPVVPTAFDLRGIAHHKGLWFAAGQPDATDALLLTSDDAGTTWTEQTNPHDRRLNATTAEDSGILVAVGLQEAGDAYIVTSSFDDDGETWTEQTNPKNIDLLGITQSAGGKWADVVEA
ncbi:MAG: WD40/YVTN/BNR-like repeat-containing protein, partial [Planctomycetota bacterium]